MQIGIASPESVPIQLNPFFFHVTSCSKTKASSIPSGHLVPK